jgi:hypothetical protein
VSYAPSGFVKGSEFLDTTARELFERSPRPTTYMLKVTVWNENKARTVWLTEHEMLSYALYFIFTRWLWMCYIFLTQFRILNTLYLASYMQYFARVLKKPSYHTLQREWLSPLNSLRMSFNYVTLRSDWIIDNINTSNSRTVFNRYTRLLYIDLLPFAQYNEIPPGPNRKRIQK